MALSRDYTAGSLWIEAVRDIQGNAEVSTLDFEKYRLMNRACSLIAGTVYDALWPFYLTRVVPVISSTGNYSTTTGTWTASTSTLAITMSSDFTSNDIGKFIVFHDGTSVYGGQIDSVGGVGSVVVAGDNLPSGNIASVDYAIMLATTPTSDTLTLTNLRLMRSGQQVRMTIESTATASVRFAALKDFNTWDTASFQHRDSIIWTMIGDDVLLKKPTALASYGTLTLTYPRVPLELTADADVVDMADGSPMELTILYLSQRVKARLSLPKDDLAGQIRYHLENLYRNFGMEVDTKLIAEKIKALQQ